MTFDALCISFGDALNLYEGTDATGPVFRELGGCYGAGIEQTTGPDLYVLFATNNDFYTNTGFAATLSCHNGKKGKIQILLLIKYLILLDGHNYCHHYIEFVVHRFLYHNFF